MQSRVTSGLPLFIRIASHCSCIGCRGREVSAHETLMLADRFILLLLHVRLFFLPKKKRPAVACHTALLAVDICSAFGHCRWA